MKAKTAASSSAPTGEVGSATKGDEKAVAEAAPAKKERAKPAFYTVDHYDVERSAADDLAATVTRAQAQGKRVLVQVGGDWCGWCHRMSDFMETNPAVRDRIEQNYVVMKVTYDDKQKNEEFLAKYPQISGYPHLFVLETDGELLHSQGTGELEEGQGYNEAVYLEFLDKWKPAG